jgi:hypothetical protein
MLPHSTLLLPPPGRLRPDFLHRCRPDGVTATGFDIFQEVTCDAPNSDTVIDGRLSFPSGHSSNTMSLAWFTALYLVWSLYHRCGGGGRAGEGEGGGMRGGKGEAGGGKGLRTALRACTVWASMLL